MQKLREVLDASPLVALCESQVARKHLEAQIRKRFGAQVLKDWGLEELKTFSGFVNAGFRIKPQEKALWAVVFRRTIDEYGNEIRRKPERIAVFHPLQVRKVGSFIR